MLQKKRRIQEAADRESRRQLAAEALVLLKKELDPSDIETAASVLMIVPHFESVLATPPESRLKAFQAALEASAKAASEKVKDASSHAHLQATFAHRCAETSVSLPVINACTTCGGQCCRQGKDTAFLSPDFLAWRMLQDPEALATPNVIIEQYLKRLPNQSYSASCLYHTDTGCAMPREIRSSTCNDFLCTGVCDQKNEIEAAPQSPSVAVSSARGAFVRASGMDTVDEATTTNAYRVGVMNDSGERRTLLLETE